jgi:hypothetical protein
MIFVHEFLFHLLELLFFDMLFICPWWHKIFELFLHLFGVQMCNDMSNGWIFKDWFMGTSFL